MNSADVVPEGRVAELWMVQLVPFQRKTNGVLVVEALSDPTAVQAVADEHDTERSTPPVPGPLSGVLGIVSTFQLVPSQRSTCLLYTSDAADE